MALPGGILSAPARLSGIFGAKYVNAQRARGEGTYHGIRVAVNDGDSSTKHRGIPMTMTKLLVTIVASTFALCSAASFAAGAMKLEDLTTEQRTDMRSRADQLIANRAANGGQTVAVSHQTPAVKKPDAKKY
jgi:hypothetical protein